MGLVHALKRHPLPIAAHFDFSLVLTYALPREVLAPLLPPGLELDAHEDLGFVAIALGQSRCLRPAFLPAFCGLDCCLASYRVFVRYHSGATGRRLRGLHVLRSDTNHRLLQHAGNVLTHDRYRHADIRWQRVGADLRVSSRTRALEADLDLTAFGGDPHPPLPVTSPFKTWHQAREFAGPMPFTFDYEEASHGIIVVENSRAPWQPRPVRAAVETLTFFQQPSFRAAAVPRLASAFIVENVSYQSSRGVHERLSENPVFAPSPTA